MTAEEVARRAAEAMAANDKAPAGLGIVVEAVAPGAATASMSVVESMVNAHGTCHGGYLFALADTAFAYACNSYRHRAVAQHCSIAFLAPAQVGTRMIAVARECYRAERSGIYDVTVSDDGGRTIAEFRGMSRTLPGNSF